MTVCGEKVTGVCVAGKCPYFKRCHPVVWDKYGKTKPKTNEEWLRQASTEELADVLTEIACESYYDGLDEKLPLKHNCKHFMKWLKEIHDEM